jgi:hypothetical protein
MHAVASRIPAWSRNFLNLAGFLWTGGEQALGGNCRVAWPVVCRPRDMGVLGLVDLRRFGAALRIRWEWLHGKEDHRRAQALFECYRIHLDE